MMRAIKFYVRAGESMLARSWAVSMLRWLNGGGWR
jgi:hypothetical protein